jgi:hypothetical protein
LRIRFGRPPQRTDGARREHGIAIDEENEFSAARKGLADPGITPA